MTVLFDVDEEDYEGFVEVLGDPNITELIKIDVKYCLKLRRMYIMERVTITSAHLPHDTLIKHVNKLESEYKRHMTEIGGVFGPDI